jgi:hypothetical protein
VDKIKTKAEVDAAAAGSSGVEKNEEGGVKKRK